MAVHNNTKPITYWNIGPIIDADDPAIYSDVSQAVYYLLCGIRDAAKNTLSTYDDGLQTEAAESFLQKFGERDWGGTLFTVTHRCRSFTPAQLINVWLDVSRYATFCIVVENGRRITWMPPQSMLRLFQDGVFDL